MRSGAFVAGFEREEAQALWAQVDASAVRRKSLFDEAWFDNLLSHVGSSEKQTPTGEADDAQPVNSALLSVPQRSDRLDWVKPLM